MATGMKPYSEACERNRAPILGVLQENGVLVVYGPFTYGGRHTSESNARFAAGLRARDRLSGIRNFEGVDRLAGEQDLQILRDFAMPANNRSLVWRKQARDRGCHALPLSV